MIEEDKKESGEISRRKFLKDAGLIVGGAAIGSTVLLAACGEGEVTTETVTKTTTVTETVSKFICPYDDQEFTSLSALQSHVESAHPTVAEVSKSGYIAWNPDECGACSRCLMVCAAYHEGAVAPQLSAIKWVENDFFYGFRPRQPLFCQQCSHPECYFNCPLDAIVIDSATGARYIDKEKCNGCGICVEACPFEVPRINIDTENMVAIKCDLCKDRAGGPACIEVCDREALSLASKEGRL